MERERGTNGRQVQTLVTEEVDFTQEFAVAPDHGVR